VNKSFFKSFFFDVNLDNFFVKIVKTLCFRRVNMKVIKEIHPYFQERL